MICLTDRTLNESQGSYARTCEIMGEESPKTWMLRSDVSISFGTATINYVLHFWYHGDIYIVDTNRPLTLDIPDIDLRELFEWCTMNGWNTPILHKDLMRDHRAFQFWMRMYNAGLIEGKEFQEREQEEKERFEQIIIEEEADGPGET